MELFEDMLNKPTIESVTMSHQIGGTDEGLHKKEGIANMMPISNNVSMTEDDKKPCIMIRTMYVRELGKHDVESFTFKHVFKTISKRLVAKVA